MVAGRDDLIGAISECSDLLFKVADKCLDALFDKRVEGLSSQLPCLREPVLKFPAVAL